MGNKEIDFKISTTYEMRKLEFSSDLACLSILFSQSGINKAVNVRLDVILSSPPIPQQQES